MKPPTPGVRPLHFFYSSANQDNYLGLQPMDDSYSDLGSADIWVYPDNTTHPPGVATHPLDLYFSRERNDYQNVGSDLSASYLGREYKFVTRLGYVLVSKNPKPSPSSKCKCGLPSITADDPAFGGSYWRGRIWGPMNALVWFGLKHPRYANVTAVTAARRALVSG